ncbi:RNA polymerase factor sigma-54 [Calycomorphotria hydatis]|uniref:RNA polymerase sigma-54 factor n=1 Tax=Calycomorphotria hydatis TaxID=2528027 RepID=A0A517T718_9PLAN|nr:RNA polymerase factor sigma-54 [Calycomorphotria hydatis]QDT64168.1 RNA polymerase sigma-54 factor [Calycomorphotria hydatis]
MQLNFSQQMKMSQSMKLAPRMIQSMEILQLPIMALNERIDEELAENVALELTEKESEISDTEREVESERARDEVESEKHQRDELVVDSDHSNEADFERLVEMAADWPEDNISSGSKVSSNRLDELGDLQNDAMANMTARPPSLHEHLAEQFGFFNVPESISEFGEFLIQNLDQDGRLQNSLEELMMLYGKPITGEDATTALTLIQKLEPAGVGARDLKECLLLQVTHDMPYRDALITLISGHLEDLAQNRIPIIQKKTGLDIETIKDASEFLGHLNPHPGRGYDSIPAQNVTPDLEVDRDAKGKYTVKLLDEYTPSLRISPYYLKQLKGNPDAQTKEYIRKKIDSAKWLIESIEQRNNTLRKVAQAIVDHQIAFFEDGPEAIAPLKMQQIADVVGVHVTTVSRAVDDKWMQTPRGLFPLKRFFGGGTQTADGDEVAWDIIRIKLKEVVDNEDKSHPLSDDALVEELKKHGYHLARRTVTKYRKNMNIPSSRQRREY